MTDTDNPGPARQYLFAADDFGGDRRVPLDPANVERQMSDLRAAGQRPYLLDEDELIDLGAAVNRWRVAQRAAE